MMSPAPVRIGHRGAAGYAPENTLASIDRALSIGVDYIEVDVQRTRDNHLILLHDKRVDRTTNGTGFVEELTISEIRQLDAGDGQQIPMLSEVLHYCSGKTGLMLELVSEGIANEVISAVERAGYEGELIFASFLHAEVLAVRHAFPGAVTLALMEGIPVSRTAFALDARSNYAGLGFDSVRPEIVDALHNVGVRVVVYTLNDERDIQRALAWGVDGIVSDYPDRVYSSEF